MLIINLHYVSVTLTTQYLYDGKFLSRNTDISSDTREVPRHCIGIVLWRFKLSVTAYEKRSVATKTLCLANGLYFLELKLREKHKGVGCWFATVTSSEIICGKAVWKIYVTTKRTGGMKITSSREAFCVFRQVSWAALKQSGWGQDLNVAILIENRMAATTRGQYWNAAVWIENKVALATHGQ
jgi:hypothetical protein